MGDVDQGIVHVVGPQLGPDPAGHDRRLRRLAHLDARRVRRAGVRHRHQRGRARAGHADAAAQALQDHGDHRRRRAARRASPPRTSSWPSSPRSAPAAARATSSSTAASAIEALSMEARMTVCNMSIEAGARAGMIAPDQTTFDYLQGRPHAPTGADWDAAVAYWPQLRTDDDAVFDAEVVLDAAELDAVRHLGHQPRPGPAAVGVASPTPSRSPTRATGVSAARALEYMGLEAGHAAARHRGRHRLRRLVHQRPHRGPAGRRRGRQGPPGRRRRADARRPRLGPGAPAGRGRGPRQGLHSRPAPSGASPAARCAWA